MSQYYSLQLDESTDVSNNANLLVFIRYEFDNKIQEYLLFCHSLPTRITAEALFNSLNNFITKNEIEWSKCIGISTDGARAMSGRINGLVAFVKAVAPAVVWNHCCIHRDSLASKNMSTDLKKTLDEVVKVVNFIKRLVHLIIEFLKFCARRWEVNIHSSYYTQKYVGCHVEKYLIGFLSFAMKYDYF